MKDPANGASEALDAFKKAAGTSGDDGTDMRDLLTSIAHWFERKLADPHGRFNAALEVYNEESKTDD